MARISMRMMLLVVVGFCMIQVSVTKSVSVALVTTDKTFPKLSEQFYVETVDLIKGPVGFLQVVNQTIAWDAKARRSFIGMDGILTQGHLEQLTRDDIVPGYELTLQSPTGMPSKVSCLNQTLNSKEYTFPDFWAFVPPNATFVDKETINVTRTGAVTCDRWDYWFVGEKYSLYVTEDSAGQGTPYRVSKIYTANPGYALYHIDWIGFVAGAPPQSFFQPSDHCAPPASSTNTVPLVSQQRTHPLHSLADLSKMA